MLRLLGEWKLRIERRGRDLVEGFIVLYELRLEERPGCPSVPIKRRPVAVRSRPDRTLIRRDDEPFPLKLSQKCGDGDPRPIFPTFSRARILVFAASHDEMARGITAHL